MGGIFGGGGGGGDNSAAIKAQEKDLEQQKLEAEAREKELEEEKRIMAEEEAAKLASIKKRGRRALLAKARFGTAQTDDQGMQSKLGGDSQIV